jgi:hypothetical protein
MQFSIGSADLYLTSSPQVTFWKQPTKRHTRFSLDHTTIPVQGTSDFGQRPSVTVTKAGDLLLNVWLEVTLPDLASYEFRGRDGTVPTSVRWVPKVGLALIKSAELEIGGQRIERLVPEYCDAMMELTEPEDRLVALHGMLSADTGGRVMVPLRFYFHDNPALALPLCAIMYHDIRINLELERAENLLNSTGCAVSTAYLGGDMTKPLSLVAFECHVTYVMLDPDERRRFTDTSQEYLITTPQYGGADPYTSGTTTRRFDMAFSNPVKELVWVYAEDAALASDSLTGNRIFDYWSYGGASGPSVVGGPTTAWTVRATGAYDPGSGGTIVVPNPVSDAGAVTRVSLRDGSGATIPSTAFTTTVTATAITVRIAPGAWVDPVNASVSATRVPSEGSSGLPPIASAKLVLMGTDRFKERAESYFSRVQPYEHHRRVPCKPIYCYSFAMWPEELQPSGTANFSKIDNAALVMTFPPSTANGRMKIFARAYNVLRIDRGIASLVYTS